MSIKQFLFIFLFFSPLFFCNAQTPTLRENIQTTVVPEFPKANQVVSVNIESYSTDLNRAEISWYKNNILEQRSIGAKSFSFETRGLGSSDTITIRVNRVFVKAVIITPAEVDLILESDSYTPPFYKGKALNSRQSEIKIVAVPHFISLNGNKFDSNNLIYEWKKDWRVLGSKSGYGKDTLVLEGLDIDDGTIISVDVETSGGSIRARNRIVVNNQEPKIIFYEDDPLLGIVYENALKKGLNLSKDEITIKAIPFFFSNKDLKQGNLKYKWSMNDNLLVGLENQDNLVLRRGESGGFTELFLEIANLTKIMQFARNNLSISFGNEQESGNIFGF